MHEKRWIAAGLSVLGITLIAVLSESRQPLHYVATENTPLRPAKKLSINSSPYSLIHVKGAIARARAGLGLCYTSMRGRASIADLEKVTGRVVMDWSILPNGEVEDPVVVQSEFPDDGFKTCLAAEVSKIIFPPPPDHNKFFVAHTFQFGREEAKRRVKAND